MMMMMMMCFHKEMFIIYDVDHCTVRFVPHENGVHQVFVRQNGVPIVGSPFRIMVGDVDADPSLVRVYGEGLSKGQTGKLFTLLLHSLINLLINLLRN